MKLYLTPEDVDDIFKRCVRMHVDSYTGQKVIDIPSSRELWSLIQDWRQLTKRVKELEQQVTETTPSGMC